MPHQTVTKDIVFVSANGLPPLTREMIDSKVNQIQHPDESNSASVAFRVQIYDIPGGTNGLAAIPAIKRHYRGLSPRRKDAISVIFMCDSLTPVRRVRAVLNTFMKTLVEAISAQRVDVLTIVLTGYAPDITKKIEKLAKSTELRRKMNKRARSFEVKSNPRNYAEAKDIIWMHLYIRALADRTREDQQQAKVELRRKITIDKLRMHTIEAVGATLVLAGALPATAAAHVLGPSALAFLIIAGASAPVILGVCQSKREDLNKLKDRLSKLEGTN